MLLVLWSSRRRRGVESRIDQHDPRAAVAQQMHGGERAARSGNPRSRRHVRARARASAQGGGRSGDARRCARRVNERSCRAADQRDVVCEQAATPPPATRTTSRQPPRRSRLAANAARAPAAHATAIVRAEAHVELAPVASRRAAGGSTSTWPERHSSARAHRRARRALAQPSATPRGSSAPRVAGSCAQSSATPRIRHSPTACSARVIASARHCSSATITDLLVRAQRPTGASASAELTPGVERTVM